MTEEQIELMRQAAQKVVNEAASGRSVDPYRLAWAQQTVANIKPLGRPLSDGAPTRAPAHLAAENPTGEPR